MKLRKYKTARGIFRAAYRLIKDEKHWTQKANARLANGSRDYNSGCGYPNAVRFCSYGALIVVADSLTLGLYSSKQHEVVLALAAHSSFYGCLNSADIVIRHNDVLDHKRVVEWWERTGKAKGWL